MGEDLNSEEENSYEKKRFLIEIDLNKENKGKGFI